MCSINKQTNKQTNKWTNQGFIFYKQWCAGLRIQGQHAVCILAVGLLHERKEHGSSPTSRSPVINPLHADSRWEILAFWTKAFHIVSIHLSAEILIIADLPSRPCILQLQQDQHVKSRNSFSLVSILPSIITCIFCPADSCVSCREGLRTSGPQKASMFHIISQPSTQVPHRPGS